MAIKRKDNGEWAIPGGMVEAGDNVSLTLKKEFMEEAGNSLGKSAEQVQELKDSIKKLFDNPTEIARFKFQK